MQKRAPSDYPIHDVIADRWSPYGFDGCGVSEADMCSLLEAARWAASSYNEQPWTFVVARREDEAEFAAMLECLVEVNRQWAVNAGALILTCANHAFVRNGKPNTAALHDLGLAVGNLSVEATARGLSLHQMKGIDAEKAHGDFGVPEGIEVVTAIAIGYAADPSSLDEALRQRDVAERHRKPLAKFVFSGKWGHTADFLGE